MNRSAADCDSQSARNEQSTAQRTLKKMNIAHNPHVLRYQVRIADKKLDPSAVEIYTWPNLDDTLKRNAANAKHECLPHAAEVVAGVGNSLRYGIGRMEVMSNRLVAVERKSMDKQRDTWHRRHPWNSACYWWHKTIVWCCDLFLRDWRMRELM